MDFVEALVKDSLEQHSLRNLIFHKKVVRMELSIRSIISTQPSDANQLFEMVGVCKICVRVREECRVRKSV